MGNPHRPSERGGSGLLLAIIIAGLIGLLVMVWSKMAQTRQFDSLSHQTKVELNATMAAAVNVVKDLFHYNNGGAFYTAGQAALPAIFPSPYMSPNLVDGAVGLRPDVTGTLGWDFQNNATPGGRDRIVIRLPELRGNSSSIIDNLFNNTIGFAAASFSTIQAIAVDIDGFNQDPINADYISSVDITINPITLQRGSVQTATSRTGQSFALNVTLPRPPNPECQLTINPAAPVNPQTNLRAWNFDSNDLYVGGNSNHIVPDGWDTGVDNHITLRCRGLMSSFLIRRRHPITGVDAVQPIVVSSEPIPGSPSTIVVPVPAALQSIETAQDWVDVIPVPLAVPAILVNTCGANSDCNPGDKCHCFYEDQCHNYPGPKHMADMVVLTEGPNTVAGVPFQAGMAAEGVNWVPDPAESPERTCTFSVQHQFAWWSYAGSYDGNGTDFATTGPPPIGFGDSNQADGRCVMGFGNPNYEGSLGGLAGVGRYVFWCERPPSATESGLAGWWESLNCIPGPNCCPTCSPPIGVEVAPNTPGARLMPYDSCWDSGNSDIPGPNVPDDSADESVDCSLQFIGRSFVNQPPCFNCGLSSRDAFGMGCFAEGTMITMADGVSRPIEEIRQGDQVFNPLTGQVQEIAFTVEGPEREALVRINVEGRSVTVTRKHPILADGVYKIAGEILAGANVLVDGRRTAVISTTSVFNDDGPPTVWNLWLKTASSAEMDHSIIANGFVTGDLAIQQQLEKGRSP